MTKIFYKDDFKVLFHRTDAMGNALAIPTHDWKATVYTEFGYANQGVVASSINGIVTGAVVKAKEIVFAIDNHNLQPGRVMIDWEEFIPDTDFPDGTRRVFRTYNSGSELVLAEGDSQTAIVNALLPYQYDSAYHQAVQGGYKGTQAEYFALASQLPNAVGVANPVKGSADSLAESAEQIGGNIEALNGVVGSIEKGANTIESNADTLAESANIVKTSAEQIGGNIADLQASVQSLDDAVEGINQGASTIANSATKVENSIGGLTASAESLSESATSLSNSANTIGASADKVQQGASAIEGSVGAITNASEVLSEKSEKLGTSAETIGNASTALESLASEWVSGRKAIATALTNRKYPTEPTESFADMAQKITNMSYEEGWFAKIGYTDDNDGGIKEIIDYSYELAKGWNPNGGTLNIFKNNTNLIFAPYVDTSKYTSLAEMYYMCSKLISVPFVDTSNCTSLGGYYNGCSSLVHLQNLDTSNVVYLNTFANQCTSLESFPLIDTHKVTNMSNMCYNCRAMTSIPCLDMGAVTSMTGIFYQCTALVYAKITNLGKSTLTTYDFSAASNWGTSGEENRQSLIDSLITYSYDRASNGMATATIKLSANTKALLTEEEIAQITQKGFTIA